MLGFFKRNLQSVEENCTERLMKAGLLKRREKRQETCLEAQFGASSETVIPSYNNATNMTNR